MTYTVLDRSDVDEILSEYGLGRLVRNGNANGSVGDHYLLRCSRGTFFLRVNEVANELDVRREVDLLTYLRKHDFPCPQPVPDRKGRAYRELGGKFISLYRRIDGTILDPEKLTLPRIESLGGTLAELHIVGKGYKRGIDNRFSFERIFETYGEIRSEFPPYFRRTMRTLDEELEYLRCYLEPKLPKGIIQGNLGAENVLYKGGRVTGLLNFEASCRGKLIFDLANAVNALCFLDGSYQLDRFEALINGYESMRTLSLAEWDAFPNELRFSAARATVLSLKHAFLDGIATERDHEAPFEQLRILRREENGGMEGLLMAMATGYDYRKYQKVKTSARRR